MKVVTKLIFVRHGETDVNASGVMHKYLDPEKLNSNGIKQIEKAANKIKKFNVSGVYSSVEARADESASIISKLCSAPIIKIKGIEERNWGDYSGKPWNEIKEVLDKMTLDERYNYVPPNGESWKQFIERLGKAVKKIAKDNEGKNIVVVSHGGAIRALIPYLLNEPKETSFKYDPPSASITIFNYADGKFKKELLLDTSHLE